DARRGPPPRRARGGRGRRDGDLHGTAGRSNVVGCGPMRPRLALLLLCLAMVSGCSREPEIFSIRNARAHVEMLAGTIGSRPSGTDAHARARAYIVDQLTIFGYQVRVQE